MVIIMEDGYLMEDGARRPSSYLVCFAWRFFCFALVVGGFALLVVGFCAIISRTVVSVPRPPTIKIGHLGVVVKQLFANK